MEIPKELVELYKHWDKHTELPTSKPEVKLDSILYKEILNFSNERMSMLERKLNNSLPYSKNPIVNNYRFCNIYRELDRQTVFFHKLLKPITNNFPLWLLNMLFCRYICNTDTISKVGLLSFNNVSNSDVYEKLLNLPSPKYGNAYIFPISTIQKSQFNTREKFFCFYLPAKIKEITDAIEKFNETSVIEALKVVLPIFGFNFKFHWTEVFIDIAYQYPILINLYKSFPIGPGSIPTMKQLNSTLSPEQVCLELVSTVPKNFDYLTKSGKKIYLSTENWEGIGCEFRKYSNLKLGSGRRRKYSEYKG